MNDELISKTQLRAYLLGELTETVAEPLEERCFTEPDWHAALLTERDDLLDAWARGELMPAEREKLEARMTDLPALRDRAAFARSLHQHLSQSLSQSGALPSNVLPFRAPASPARLSAVRWSLAIAAALLLAVTGGLLWNVWRSRSTPAPLLVNQPSPSVIVGTDAPKLEDKPTQQPPKANARPTPAHREKGIVSFVLAAALVRSAESAPELTVPAHTQVLRLQLELPTEGARPQRAVLQTDAGAVIWQRRSLRPRTAGEVRYVVCDVPAALLEDAAYQLRLTQTASPDTVYSFRLKQR